MNEFVYYLLHIAPSLAVMVVMYMRLDKRMANREAVIEDMLESCWNRLLSHVETDEHKA